MTPTHHPKPIAPPQPCTHAVPAAFQPLTPCCFCFPRTQIPLVRPGKRNPNVTSAETAQSRLLIVTENIRTSFTYLVPSPRHTGIHQTLSHHIIMLVPRCCRSSSDFLQPSWASRNFGKKGSAGRINVTVLRCELTLWQPREDSTPSPCPCRGCSGFVSIFSGFLVTGMKLNWREKTFPLLLEPFIAVSPLPLKRSEQSRDVAAPFLQRNPGREGNRAGKEIWRRRKRWMRRAAQGGPCCLCGGCKTPSGRAWTPKGTRRKGQGHTGTSDVIVPNPRALPRVLCPRTTWVVAVTSPRLLLEINWKQELLPLSHVYYSYYLCVDLIPCNDLIC